MKVRLKNKWFAPSPSRSPNKLQRMSGQRFPAGVQTISGQYEEDLPQTAYILSGAPSGYVGLVSKYDPDVDYRGTPEEVEEVVEEEVEDDLHAADLARAVGNAEAEANEAAQAQATAFQAQLEAEEAEEAAEAAEANVVPRGTKKQRSRAKK